MKSPRRGSVSVEMLIAMPLVLLAIQGMVMLFETHLARQRTYAALPEVSRDPVGSFAPHQEARCRIEGFRSSPGSSLNADELAACRAVEYFPPQELRRVGFGAETTCAPSAWPSKIRMRTKYAVTRLKE